MSDNSKPMRLVRTRDLKLGDVILVSTVCTADIKEADAVLSEAEERRSEFSPWPPVDGLAMDSSGRIRVDPLSVHLRPEWFVIAEAVTRADEIAVLTLAHVNEWMRPSGLNIIVEHWDGEGERTPTKFVLMTSAAFDARCKPAEDATADTEQSWSESLRGIGLGERVTMALVGIRRLAKRSGSDDMRIGLECAESLVATALTGVGDVHHD